MRVYSARVHNIGHTGQSNKILEGSIDLTFHHCSGPLAERLSINIAIQAIGRDEISYVRHIFMTSIDDNIKFENILLCTIFCTKVTCHY